MPKFLEDRLKAEAAAKGLTGRAAARYTYGTLNDLGAMSGNQETAKGRAMQAKHVRDVASGKAAYQPVTAPPAAQDNPPLSSGSGRAAGLGRPHITQRHPGQNLGKFLHPPKLKIR